MAESASDERRIMALCEYDVDNIGRSGIFDALLQLAADLSGVPGAAINLVESAQQVNIASFNLDLPIKVVRNASFCTTVVEQNDMLEICDAALDPRFASNSFVTESNGLRYYAGFPLRSPDGFALGTLCVADTTPHRLDASQKARLSGLAAVASQLLEVHRTDYIRQRMSTFLQIQSEIISQTELSTPLRTLGERLISGLERCIVRTRAALMAIDGDGVLRLISGHSMPAAFAQHCDRLKQSLTGLPCAIAAHTRTAIVCTDVSADPQWQQHATFLAELGIGSFLSMPMFANAGALIGTFAVFFDRPHEPSANERELIDVAAGSAAILLERNEALSRLIESERRLNEAQEIARLGAYSVHPDRSVRTGSAITNEILGLPSDLPSLSTEEYNRMILPEDMPTVLAFRKQAENSKVPLKIIYRIHRANDGAVRWIEGYAVAVHDAAGNVLRYSGVISDVTERRLAEQALRLNQRAVESSSTAIVIVDALQPDMPMTYVNSAFERLTGYTRDESIGRNCRFLQGTEHNQTGLRDLRYALKNQQDCHALLRNFRSNGEEYWVDLHIAPVRDESGAVTHYVGFQNDCSARIRFENELIHQAGHDSLTGLANRNLLQDRIDQTLIRSHSNNAPVCHAVTFIDIDHFKLINDSLGHAAGDQLLKECAQRITGGVGSLDTVARMGGDEFVILLCEVADEISAVRQIEAILSSLKAPFFIDGQTISVTASAGIALYPTHGGTASTLLRHADVAMYNAKSHGRARSRVFSDALSQHASDSLQLKHELTMALNEHQFCVHYQPKISAHTGDLIGFEALVRWNHPTLGLLYPGAFIDAAEAFGLISELGAWVIEEACRQAVTWHRTHRYSGTIAVNVSAAQFRKSNFVEDVEQILANTGLAASFLELEITESLVMESPEQFIHILSELHRLGIMMSVDDFGTGYSSLSFVKQFPIDYLKIDRSFVNDISTDPSDAAMCNTIITMAHNLGLLAIAEGVETVEQATFLQAHGCDILQGYLISKPMQADADFGVFPRQINAAL